MQEDNEEFIRPKNKQIEKEHWMRAFWRPHMGYLYMIICLFDFIIFPIITTTAIPIINKKYEIPYEIKTWEPLTLGGSGLLHLSFMGILGAAAYTRGKEKIAAIENRKNES